MGADTQITPEGGQEPTPEGGQEFTPEQYQELQQQHQQLQERYDNLRPQYDRTKNEAREYQQRLNALENDDDALRQFLAQKGFEFDEPEDPALAALQQRQTQLEQRLQQEDQQRQQAQQEAAIDGALTAGFTQYEKDRGAPLSDEEKSAVVGFLTSQPPGPDGLPDVTAGLKALDAMYAAQQERWAATKRTAYQPGPGGQAATEAPDSTDPGQRRAWIAERLNQMAQT